MSDATHLLDELVRAPADTMDRLRQGQGDGAIVVAALQLAGDERQRVLLCDALGSRKEASAVDALLLCLRDDSAKVRSAAADALAKLADPRAGEALLARASSPTPDDGARRMMVTALGAVGHQPAIPFLIELLASEHPSMRGSAAWSLGALRATSATEPLRQALDRELSPYAIERMREALHAITAGA